jgi:hypothetical protein
MDDRPAPQPPWAHLLPVRRAPALPPQARAVFLCGDARVHTVATHVAARMFAHGLNVAIIDADMAFQLRPLEAMAKACRVQAEVFLRRAHIVRAFTCWQLTTLFCAGLAPVLATHPLGRVLLLTSLTPGINARAAGAWVRRALGWAAGPLSGRPPPGAPVGGPRGS